MKKKIISILLALTIVLALIPLTAFAGTETEYELWISDIKVTESNMTDVLGDADGAAKTVSFDPETNTLTLNGAVISETGKASGFNYVRAVESELDTLNVNLIGANRIGKEVTSASSLDDYSIDVGFFCTGNIVFTGDAGSSLTVYDYSAGIYANNVTFTENFKGKLTIRDCGGSEPMPPCAINAFGTFDDQTWEFLGDGTVNIFGGKFDIASFESNAIEAFGEVTVKNAELTINAAIMDITSDRRGITISDSKLTAVGDSCIDATRDILIENVDLKLTADGAEGIEGRANVTLKNCAAIDIAGADEALMVTKKVSFINCPNVKLSACAMNAINSGDILFDNSTVTVTTENGYNGLSAMADEDGDGTITVKNSRMTVNADGSGIRCNSLAVSGGKTEMYCSGKKYGALIYGDESAISIAGCTVKLTGEEGAIKFTAEGDSDPFNGSLPKATFKGNTAVNTFAPLQEVNYKSEKGPVTNTYNEYAYVGNDMAKSLAVIHTHNPVKIVGKPATKNESGWKDYYQCKDSFDACGEYFEDAAGLIMIDDLEEWKAPGGNGHLPKSDDPKPGDNGDIFLWITVLAASLAGIVICLTLAKKRIRNN